MVTELARALVSTPDAVEVSVVDADRGPTVQVRVADDEMGQIIGRGGRVVRALRTLVGAASPPRERVFLDVVE